MTSFPHHPITSSPHHQAVLITGAAKRLGHEIALYLAEQGFDIALHYHTSKTAAEWTCEEITKLGRKCAIFQADLSDLTALAPLVLDVFRAMPQCKHLVNSAAVFKRGPFLEADVASLQLHMAVNLTAPIVLTREFVKRCPLPTPLPQAGEGSREAAGEGISIVNMLDSKIRATQHNYFYYLLSKKALVDFTLMAAADLAPKVRVNGVCPSSVMETSDGLHPAPATPHATPREVAAAVHRLIASEANGELVFLDGK